MPSGNTRRPSETDEDEEERPCARPRQEQQQQQQHTDAAAADTAQPTEQGAAGGHTQSRRGLAPRAAAQDARRGIRAVAEYDRAGPDALPPTLPAVHGQVCLGHGMLHV
jgi:hypothetical protein